MQKRIDLNGATAADACFSNPTRHEDKSRHFKQLF